jgi:hypothetical protein
VPQPALHSLTPSALRESEFRSAAARRETIFSESARRARFFMKHAPVFRAPKTLQQLERKGRRKNLDVDVKSAERAVEELRSKPTRHTSARWIDANGVPLACYLSSRFMEVLNQKYPLRLILTLDPQPADPGMDIDEEDGDLSDVDGKDGGPNEMDLDREEPTVERCDVVRLPAAVICLTVPDCYYDAERIEKESTPKPTVRSKRLRES